MESSLLSIVPCFLTFSFPQRPSFMIWCEVESVKNWLHTLVVSLSSIYGIDRGRNPQYTTLLVILLFNITDRNMYLYYFHKINCNTGPVWSEEFFCIVTFYCHDSGMDCYYWNLHYLITEVNFLYLQTYFILFVVGWHTTDVVWVK